MIFLEPREFREAIEAAEVRAILPTEFRTFLLSLISPEIRARAFFSAGVINAELLDTWHTLVGQILDGTVDRSEARLRMKEQLDALGYVPPEGARGSLLDLSSDARTNLILDQNVAFARGAGQFAQRQDETILDLWPVQELFRAQSRLVPRDWPGRWRNNGGQFFGGRMMARVDDPIWTRISRFGHPHPPFDFNSGMWVRAIEREIAEDLGVIAPGEAAPEPQPLDFNDGLQSSPRVRSRELRAAIEESGVGRFDDAGVLRFTGTGGVN